MTPTGADVVVRPAAPAAPPRRRRARPVAAAAILVGGVVVVTRSTDDRLGYSSGGVTYLVPRWVPDGWVPRWPYFDGFQDGIGDFEGDLTRLGRLTREVQDKTMEFRMVPLGTMTTRLERTVRSTGESCGKQVDFAIDGEQVALDKSLLELAMKFLPKNDAKMDKIGRIVAGLEGVYVRVFEFGKPGQYLPADVDNIVTVPNELVADRPAPGHQMAGGHPEAALVEASREVRNYAFRAAGINGGA